MGNVVGLLQNLFKRKKIELVLVGVENTGKTTLLNLLASGETVQTTPTVGLNLKTFKKKGVGMKAWDLGGQAKCREEWPRYTKGCDVIVYLVDASDRKRLDTSRYELHRLLENPDLARLPLLVLGNKVDIQNHLTHDQLIQGLRLDYITDNKWELFNISAHKGINLDKVVDWLVRHGK